MLASVTEIGTAAFTAWILSDSLGNLLFLLPDQLISVVYDPFISCFQWKYD
jgi:hypothetical protein